MRQGDCCAAGPIWLDVGRPHHLATPPAPRADNGSTHEPSDRHRSDPSSLAAPAGSPASWPGLEHGCEYHEPSALDATRTRHSPPRSTTSPRLVGATPAPPACESARSTQEVHSHHMPSPDTDWSCWSKASEIPQSNLTYSIRLQRNSGPAHYPLRRTGCLPRGLPLVSPMRLVVVRTRTGTTSPAAPA